MPKLTYPNTDMNIFMINPSEKKEYNSNNTMINTPIGVKDNTIANATINIFIP